LHSKQSHGRALTVLLLLTVLLFSISGGAGALYLLTGADDAAVVLNGSSQLPDVSDSLLDINSGTHGHDTVITEGAVVYVEHDGAVTLLQSEGESISSLLKRSNALPGPLEMVGVDISGESVTLTVAEQLVCYEQVTETVARPVTYIANSDLPQGTETILQEGSDGVQTAIYEQTWSYGEMISRQMVKITESTAVEQIVEYGTDVSYVSPDDALVNVEKNRDGSGILTFASGATMKFTASKDMTATAYTAGHGGADYTTATGTFVKIGVVAVDKRVIPLGTRMYIITDDNIIYGVATAEDTGVRGNVVDLYMDTYWDCINFGRRGCTVYILP